MSASIIGEPRARRTQAERRGATTTAVVAATVDAVLDTGPATGLADIARRAGVTKGALQHHYATKDDLLVAVVEAGWNDLIDRLDRSDSRSESATDRVRSLLGITWESYQEPACRAAYLISSDPNVGGELVTRLGVLFDTARERLDALWTGQLCEFELPARQVRSARRFARSHLLGMLAQRRLASIEPDPADELAALEIAILQMLGLPVST